MGCLSALVHTSGIYESGTGINRPLPAGENIMLNNPVSRSIYQFAELVQEIADSDLEREWTWGSYKSEGVRFAYFRNYEELRELAVELYQARAASGAPLSAAQRILAQYHSAYMDLQGVLSGVGSEYDEKPPAEGEWPLRRVVAHIIGADLGFYVTIKYALDRYRQGLDPLVKIEDETWVGIAGMDESELDAMMDGSLSGLQSFHRDLHKRILIDFAEIDAVEIERPSRYWEDEPMSLRFRMHRFDSHMRQHTIQVEKTLQMLGHVHSESQRLLRLIFFALAQAEGVLIGAGRTQESLLIELAERIDGRTREIRNILAR